MRRFVLSLLCIALAACGGKKGASSAKVVRIAAAADLARAFEEIAPAFEKATGIKAIVTPGSTGLLAKQIAQRAPFDLFAAANVSYVDEVVRSGACDGKTQALYARGRLVVWARGADAAPAKLTDLVDPRYKRIAIANPEHAPYGIAAKQALQKAGIWDQIADRMTYGENVQVAMQWAKAGEADAAVVALSLAVVADGGSSIPVEEALHDPLDQAMVVCGTGPGATAAAKFQAYIGSPEGREIMSRYGFLLPGETAPPPKGGTGGDRLGSGTGTGSGTAAVQGKRVDEATARALVDAWLAAQNGGDFTAYQAVYADRFAGIKRAGPRTRKYDRAGWIKDRGRMFKAKMKVTADDVAVTSVGTMAVVRFRQTYVQGKFKDSGDKQLVVIDTKDGLRIAREEMLTSTLGDAGGKEEAIYSVVHDDAGSWMILGEANVDEETQGKPKSGGGGAGFDYSTHEALAAERALVGSQVTLYPSGKTCAIAEISVMSMLTPHFGTTFEWRGDWDGDGTPDSPALDDAAIDLEVAAGGARHLAADVSGCAGGKEDVVGVLGAAADLTHWAAVDDPLEDAARDAHAKLDDFKTIQDEYVNDYGGQGTWTESVDAEVTVQAWKKSDDDRIIMVAARAGSGCGDFSGELVALFQATGTKLTLLGLVPLGGSPLPTVVLETDKGQLELAAPASIYERGKDGFEEATDLDLGYRDCDC